MYAVLRSLCKNLEKGRQERPSATSSKFTPHQIPCPCPFCFSVNNSDSVRTGLVVRYKRPREANICIVHGQWGESRNESQLLLRDIIRNINLSSAGWWTHRQRHCLWYGRIPCIVLWRHRNQSVSAADTVATYSGHYTSCTTTINRYVLCHTCGC